MLRTLFVRLVGLVIRNIYQLKFSDIPIDLRNNSTYKLLDTCYKPARVFQTKNKPRDHPSSDAKFSEIPIDHRNNSTYKLPVFCDPFGFLRMRADKFKHAFLRNQKDRKIPVALTLY